MSAERAMTIWLVGAFFLLCATFVLMISYNTYIMTCCPDRRTVSEVIREFAHDHPMIVFMTGGIIFSLATHWLWYR